jgi:hypothetical protein
VGIPLKAITDSAGKPIGIPEESHRGSERSDAGFPSLQEVIGFAKVAGFLG